MRNYHVIMMPGLRWVPRRLNGRDMTIQAVVPSSPNLPQHNAGPPVDVLVCFADDEIERYDADYPFTVVRAI